MKTFVLRVTLAAVLVSGLISIGQGQLQWETRGHQWSQSVGAGATFWLSDFPAAPGFPDAQNYVFPDWVPYPDLFIVGAGARFDNGTLSGQIAWSVDYDRKCYNSGLPPGHQVGSFNGFCDWRADTLLVSLCCGAAETRPANAFWPPIHIDRRKDSIWFQADLAGGGLATMHLKFLVPATAQPTGLIVSPPPPPPPPPPPGQWSTVVGPVTGALDSGGWTGYTSAVVIQPSQVVNGSGGSQIRVTFAAGVGGGFSFTSAAIGPLVAGPNPYSAASMTALSCPQQSVAAGGTVVCTANVGVDGSNGYVVKQYLTGGALRYNPNQPGMANYYLSGADDTMNAAGAASYIAGNGHTNGFVRVEKFFP